MIPGNGLNSARSSRLHHDLMRPRLGEGVRRLHPHQRIGPHPNAFSNRIAISAYRPALQSRRLLAACRVTCSRSAKAVTLSPAGATISARSHRLRMNSKAVEDLDGHFFVTLT